MKLTSQLRLAAVVGTLAWPIAQGFAADADAGKALYEKNCVGCHGADGKGNATLAKTMGEKELNIVDKETKDKSDAALLKVITDGAGKMPPSKKLTAEEQKAVLQYNRSLMK